MEQRYAFGIAMLAPYVIIFVWFFLHEAYCKFKKGRAVSNA